MNDADKPLIWLKGKVKTPPFSAFARFECGMILRRLQQGQSIGMPLSRPMPSIGTRCHELRIRDENLNWRIIYRIDPDAIVIVDVFAKKTEAIPSKIIKTCRSRLNAYDAS